MINDISRNVSSARQAFDLMAEQAKEREDIEKRALQESLKLEGLFKEQTELLREANIRAAAVEVRAKKSEKDSIKAGRHAVLANVLAVISLAFSVGQFFSKN